MATMKRRSVSAKLHGAETQKTVIFAIKSNYNCVLNMSCAHYKNMLSSCDKIQMAQDRYHWQALVDMVMNFGVPWKARNLLVSWTTFDGEMFHWLKYLTPQSHSTLLLWESAYEMICQTYLFSEDVVFFLTLLSLRVSPEVLSLSHCFTGQNVPAAQVREENTRRRPNITATQAESCLYWERATHMKVDMRGTI
jgi:hypothetical protein